MITEVYIENQQVDISEDLSALINFSIDDVMEFSERSTSWSKTIVLPGSKRNNKIFGNVFEMGSEGLYDPDQPNFGYNFNPSKSAACVIFQDNMQSFKGVMRLLQVNINKHQIEYEVAVFGTLFSLNVALSGAFIDQLDFSEYNDIYNETNIVASWDNTPGSGIYYPLIDYGTYSVNKHDWDIRTFRPAIYVKEIIDKIFENAGFRYECDLFETDRFKRLIIPYNKAKLLSGESELLYVRNIGTNVIEDTAGPVYLEMPQQEIMTSFTTPDDIRFTYNDSPSYLVDVTLQMSGSYFSETNLNVYLKRGVSEDIIPVVLPSTETSSFDINQTVQITLNDNDVFYVYLIATGLSPNYFIEISDLRLQITVSGQVSSELQPGGELDLNLGLPKNIRQVDFLVSIIKLFNLYVYEDKFDESLIKLKPYVEFYDFDSANSKDWTYKLNRDKVRKVTPMSEINSKLYAFKYKEDSDYYNEVYRKRYGQTYGSYIFDSQYEFSTETNSLELIFAPTVLVGYDGESKVYPTIFKRTGSDLDPTEERVDSVIRILQTKKVTSIPEWNIVDDETPLETLTSYGYAGHLDDPQDPTNDLNFGALQELFFNLNSGALNVNQFNVYWSSYMAEITDKDSKLLKASFYLKPTDIFNFDFSDYISVDGVLYRVNKILDYNMSNPKDCEVELLKVINTTYS